jgi:hypothetical protein
VVRWRLIDLAQWIFEEFRIAIAKQTLSRELRAMGYRKLSARPRHYAQVAGAIEDFKKSFPARLDAIAREKALGIDTIEIRFADEARRLAPPSRTAENALTQFPDGDIVLDAGGTTGRDLDARMAVSTFPRQRGPDLAGMISTGEGRCGQRIILESGGDS